MQNVELETLVWSREDAEFYERRQKRRSLKEQESANDSEGELRPPDLEDRRSPTLVQRTRECLGTSVPARVVELQAALDAVVRASAAAKAA